MVRSIGRTGRLVCAAIVALALGACSMHGGQDGEQSEAPGYVQAHTIQQFMAYVVQPAASMYWQSVQRISDGAGVRDIEPETDAQWRATRIAAASLTEHGNLLMTPLYAKGRGKEWMNSARSMAEMGIQAEQAAVAKDPDQVFEIGGKLYDVCSGCHQIYPPPGQPAADPAGEPIIDDVAGSSLSTAPGN